MNTLSFRMINEYKFSFLGFWKISFLLTKKFFRFLKFFTLWSLYFVAYFFGQLEGKELGPFYVYYFFLSKVHYLFQPTYIFFYYFEKNWLYIFYLDLYYIIFEHIFMVIWQAMEFSGSKFVSFFFFVWNYMCWIYWQRSFFWLDYYDAVNPFVGKRWEYKRQNFVWQVFSNIFFRWGLHASTFFKKSRSRPIFIWRYRRPKSPYESKYKYKEIGDQLTVSSFRLLRKKPNQTKITESWARRYPAWQRKEKTDFEERKYWPGRVKGFLMPLTRVFPWDKSRANLRKLGFLFSGEMFYL